MLYHAVALSDVLPGAKETVVVAFQVSRSVPLILGSSCVSQHGGV
jgi:hypothetical protein